MVKIKILHKGINTVLTVLVRKKRLLQLLNEYNFLMMINWSILITLAMDNVSIIQREICRWIALGTKEDR